MNKTIEETKFFLHEIPLGRFIIHTDMSLNRLSKEIDRVSKEVDFVSYPRDRSRHVLFVF